MTDEARDSAASLGSHDCDRLLWLMIAIGFKAALSLVGYGATMGAALLLGMVVGVGLPIVAIVALDPWFGPFDCEECKHND